MNRKRQNARERRIRDPIFIKFEKQTKSNADSYKFLSTMEYQSAEVHHDKNGESTRNETTELSNVKVNDKDVSNTVPTPQNSNEQVGLHDFKGGDIDSQAVLAPHAEVNMEAKITPDDVMRAGGFGTRDDISSFLPVASDSTDFEASIREAQDYEQPQEEARRPGLGWTE